MIVSRERFIGRSKHMVYFDSFQKFPRANISENNRSMELKLNIETAQRGKLEVQKIAFLWKYK